MVAVNKKTKNRFTVVKYTLKVCERGSDTEFTKESFVIYNPMSRVSIPVSRANYFICDNWKQAEEMFGPQPEEDYEF